MFRKSEVIVATDADGPDVIRGPAVDGEEPTAALRLRGGDDSPGRAVPMLGEWSEAHLRIVGLSDRPHVIRSDRRHACERGAISWSIRAGHDTPIRSIPVEDECVIDAVGIPLSSDGPHIRL